MENKRLWASLAKEADILMFMTDDAIPKINIWWKI